jgi:peptidoglycan/xylan/chitin deacetylase (PgdA/CDA1 family)
MKTSLLPFLLFAAFSLPGLAEENPGAPAPQVEIARFAGNRVAAVSYTFDDGTLGHYTVAAPTLEKYGFRGTFGIVVSRTADDPEAAQKLAGPNVVRRISWKEWRELAAKGHEICNHGMEHKGLPSLNDAGLEREVNEAARIITEKMGCRPLSFIYPGNGRNPQVREFVMKNHIAVRDREQRFGGPDFNVDKANGIIDKAIKNKEAIVIMTHAVAEAGYQPISREDLDGHLLHVSAIKDKIWVDTLASVGRYVRERDAAKITIKAQAANQVTFSLACPLDPKLFNAPLTCVVHAGGPVVPDSVQCERGGIALPAVIAGDKVLVDVVPGAGQVTVRWANQAGSTK